MPGAAERFAREVRRLRATRTDAAPVVVVRCGTDEAHRLRLAGVDVVEPLDHDVDAERVLGAVGGRLPACLQLADLVPQATPIQLWTSLRGSRVSDHDGSQEALGRLPVEVRGRLLAVRLHDEFADASTSARESVAKLGLALLSPGYEPTAADVARFQLTRTLPHWDTGPRAWSDKELVLLQRLMHVAPGERLPHLGHVPSDPAGRRVLAQYAASLLDDHHLYTRSELAATLSPIHHHAARLIRLMLDEHTLEESSACYRTPPGRAVVTTRRSVRR